MCSRKTFLLHVPSLFHNSNILFYSPNDSFISRMLSRAVRTASFGINRAASTLVLAEVNGAGELQGMTHKK